MNVDPTARRSWLGQSVLRNEDERFLIGRAQYVDDITMPGLLHAAMLRSPYAHALIKRIDYSKALEMPTSAPPTTRPITSFLITFPMQILVLSADVLHPILFGPDRNRTAFGFAHLRTG